jgi:hypothetical protein
MNARRIALALGACLLVLFGIAGASGYAGYLALQKRAEKEAAAGRAELRDPRTRISYTQNLQFDFREPEKLVANVDEVFVGRVEELTGRRDNDPVPLLEGWAPQGQFRVEVVEVVKDPEGALERGKEVTVNQMGVPPEDARAEVSVMNQVGGSMQDPGDLYAAEFLRPGRYYVFATEHDRRRGWHTVRVDPSCWMVLGERMGEEQREVVERLSAAASAGRDA